jgi:tetratricopeptide (TPR) repeat protein
MWRISMDVIMIGFWIWDRARGRTKLEFPAWLRALDAEERRLRAEAPAGWASSRPVERQRRSRLIKAACLGIFVFSLATLSGCSASKQSYVAKGNKLFAAGKYEEAALNYREAIQKDAGFGEAYYRLGLTAVKLNQARDAYSTLFRAVQLLPGNVEVKTKFADVCLSLYLTDANHPQLLYSQISHLSEELLSKNHSSYEGLMLKGYLASTDRKPKEAIDYFRKALQADSSNAGVVTELANLLIQEGEVQEGERLAMNLIGEKTSYGPAYDLLYGFYLKANRPADAENVLKAKVNHNPTNADYVLQLARHYSQVHDTAQMTGTLQRLLNDPKDFPQAQLWVGDFYLGLRDYPEAIGYYQRGANAAPEAKTKVVYQIRNVIALLSQGKRDQAGRLAEQVHQEHPKDTAALRLHADILLDSGKRESADAAAQEFQKLSSQSPSDASLRLQLARAYRLKGDLESARSQLLEVTRLRSDLSAARYELAEISLIQHRPQEAVKQANEILRTQPNDRRGRLLYASGLMGTGDGETARAVLTRLINDFPKDPEPQVQLGIVALAQKAFPRAIDILSKYRATGDTRVFSALASAYLGEKEFDQARAILNEGLAKWPQSSDLLEQLGRTEALAGHYDLALAQFQKLLASDPKSVVLRRNLAEVCDLQGDHTRAIAYYQQAHQLAADDVAVTVSLADALARAGRMGEAKTIYQAVAITHPENAPVLNNVAFFLADTGGDLDEALRLAKNALAKIPGQPSFSDTIGYIYLKKGMLDSAIQSFSTLARRYPTSASFRYHLGLALFQKGEKAGARKELQSALANHPSPQETLRIRELLNEIS